MKTTSAAAPKVEKFTSQRRCKIKQQPTTSHADGHDDDQDKIEGDSHGISIVVGVVPVPTNSR